ncbi:MAG: DotA/TraY family protein [Gammaproteobacteria bacterium]
MKKLIILLFLSVLSLNVLAADYTGSMSSFGVTSPEDKKLLLTPVSTDISMSYLSAIFGIVDGVLPGSGSQILGKMFGTFNAVILLLGGVVLMYILIVGTLNTAQEGEVMGKKWSSMWIPLRAALGVAFLVPKASGYSIIQIMMMWIVTQGIGAANNIWNTTLDYLNSGGVIVNVQRGGNNPNIDKTMITAGRVLRALTCVHGLKNALAVSEPASSPALSTMMKPEKGKTSISFPNDPNYTNYKGVCGEMTWESKEETASVAAQQIIADLDGTAQQFVKAAAIRNDEDRKKAFDAISVAPYFYSVMNYGTLMMPLLNAHNVDASLSGQVQSMKSQGWIMAGSYYSAITQNMSHYLKTMEPPNVTGTDSALTTLAQKNSTLFATGSTDHELMTSVTILETEYIKEAENLKSLYFPSAAPVQFQPMHGLAIELLGLKPLQTLLNINLTPLVAPIDDAFNGLFVYPLNILVGQLLTAGTGNPITVISMFGKMLLTGSIVLWGAAGAGSITIALLVAVGSFFAPAIGSVVEIATFWMLPLVGLLVSMSFISGVMASFYIPLIPFIYFTFGAFGWLIGVIETIIAAPLVALGLMHPEGDEAFGKAAPAIMLIANVFLRPTLMLFGYIAGIIMSYIGIWLLTQGFVYATSHLLFAGIAQAVASVGVLGQLAKVLSPQGMIVATLPLAALTITTFAAIIVIYVILATTIVQKSFSLISEVPQNIMTWIGGTHHTPGGQIAQQATQEVQGKAEHAAQQGARYLEPHKPNVSFGSKNEKEKPEGESGGSAKTS